MKKTMTTIALFSAFTAFAAESTLDDSTKLTDLNHYTAQSSTHIARVKLLKDIVVDLNQDDDLYFQNGNIIKESNVNKFQPFCEIDTDIEKDFNGSNFSVSNGILTLSKGFMRSIEDVDVLPKFEENRIEYDLGFASLNNQPKAQALDELECSFPLSIKRIPTLKDLYDITGNAVVVEVIVVE